LFGAWLRRIEYTADRAGLLCCASLEDALSAISVSTFHLVGRTIDLTVFGEQQREIEAERALRIGEWISATPYATKRIAALRSFARDTLFLQWSAQFEAYRTVPFAPPLLPAGTVPRRAFAGFARRLPAFIIDAIVLETIIPNLPSGIIASSGSTADLPPWLVGLTKHAHVSHAVDSSGGLGSFILLAYVVLLVGLTGQTFGMMIMDLRVVSDRFDRIGIGRALLRYACLVGSFFCVIGILRVFGRVQPFEKWSGTRLIAGTAYARHLEQLTVQPVGLGP
jgi:uncharacterized RDD family membrane protein YckC